MKNDGIEKGHHHHGQGGFGQSHTSGESARALFEADVTNATTANSVLFDCTYHPSLRVGANSLAASDGKRLGHTTVAPVICAFSLRASGLPTRCRSSTSPTPRTKRLPANTTMTRLLFSLLPLSLIVLLLGAISTWHSADAFITSPYRRRDARIHRSPILQAIKLVEKEATDILDVVITQPVPQPGAVAALSATTTTDRDQSSGNDTVALLVVQQQQEEMKNNNALDGLLWRAVVVVLCAVWASNFPAIKLIVAEPGAFAMVYLLVSDR
jgi:hypothetical protein